MLKSGNRSVAKLKAKSKKARGSGASARLADISAKMEAARNASYVRKPVFDGSLEVIAYELMVGDGAVTKLEAVSDEQKLRFNSVLELELADINGGHPVLISASNPVLEVGLPPWLDTSDVMISLGSTFTPTPEATAAVEHLHARGFRIVLENLPTSPQLGDLIRYAWAVRIDTHGSAGTSAGKHVNVLKASEVQLMADRIGSYDELRTATSQGYTLFQGSFLSRPDAFKKTQIPAGKLAALELIALLQNPDAAISEIAEVIRRDVSLSYRILKIVNSAHYALPRPLGSIDEAVVLVGTSQIVSWVSMLNMSGVANKPTELTRAAMVRARVCETLAEKLDRSDRQRFHIVGLFSVIEALLDVPAAKALGSLPLAPEIVDAIASGGGVMGEVLRGVIAFEKGDWSHAHIVGLDDIELSRAFRSAMIETDEMWARVSG